MELDVLTLSRVQFGLTAMFHYLFPPLTIGLGVLLVIMEAMYLRTGDLQYQAMTKFWTKIFAVNFAMGVASGIVMEFQFGTNWAAYSRYVGDVFGSALAAEGIFAFFLESGFLAVLVFGWDRVSPRVHFFSTIMVALGSVFSAVWIVVANSWQQTPAGYHLVKTPLGERAEITDFWAVVFNPSSMVRLSHVLLGALVMGAFFVMSISAYYLLRGRHLDFARKTFPLALVLGLIASLLVPLVGHGHAVVVARYQPAKLAAFEGLFTTEEGATRLTLFGLPDSKSQTLRYELAVPGLLSFLVHGDFRTPVPGLDIVPPQDRPPVTLPFYLYHLMVALGLVFIGLTLLAAFFHWRGTLFQKRWLLAVFVFAVLGPYAANQAGWVAAEVGRQPWAVQNLLRTEHSFSSGVPAGQVLGSILMFTVIYALLFAVWVYVLNHKIHQGPELGSGATPTTSAEGLLSAAGGHIPGSGLSMTQTHEDNLPAPKEDEQKWT